MNMGGPSWAPCSCTTPRRLWATPSAGTTLRAARAAAVPGTTPAPRAATTRFSGASWPHTHGSRAGTCTSWGRATRASMCPPWSGRSSRRAPGAPSASRVLRWATAALARTCSASTTRDLCSTWSSCTATASSPRSSTTRLCACAPWMSSGTGCTTPSVRPSSTRWTRRWAAISSTPCTTSAPMRTPCTGRVGPPWTSAGAACAHPCPRTSHLARASAGR
mmetsp:Transcript_18808/g.63062  ORF Transcript_18808/g.63062 Transcript_18808/m.63062 type:complete len:220 (-) Transcript_18808:855-1514(-)